MKWRDLRKLSEEEKKEMRKSVAKNTRDMILNIKKMKEKNTGSEQIKDIE